MNEEADAGDLVSQRTVPIGSTDNATSLYARISETALEQIDEFTRGLTNNQLTPRAQNHPEANYWRKRSPRDGLINWRMPANSIVNLVHALAAPNPGADCRHLNRPQKIWKARVAPQAKSNLEPGKILASSSESIIVKCGDGAVELLQHELAPLPKAGDYL